MRRSMVGVLLLLGVTAQGSPALPRQGIDAFLSNHEQKPLLDSGALAKGPRERLENGRVSSTEPRHGVPTFFWAGRAAAGTTLRAQGLSAEQAARRHLAEHASLYRADAARWSEATRALVHDTGDGAIVATFRQDINGVPVFRDEIKVVMNRDLALVALAGYLTPAITPLGGFEWTEDAAVVGAFAHLTGRQLARGDLSPARDGSGVYHRYQIPGQARPARVRQVWFPLVAGLEPAFYVEVEARGASASDWYSYVVSARNGGVLFRKNLTVNDGFTYRVWADPAGIHIPDSSPNGHAPTPYPYAAPTPWSPPFVAPVAVTLAYGPLTKVHDPWLLASATTTRGNNAYAYADIADPDGFSAGDVLPDVTAPGVFDRTYNVALPPDASVDQRKAAVTQLFYDVNFLHDWYYDDGFDEASGNAQANNYGRGGLNDDAMDAEGQDFSGMDNADMSTPSDGMPPRMQMYIFAGQASADVELTDVPTASFTGAAASFGPASYSLSAVATLVDDGVAAANGGTVNDGCEPFTGVTGHIALIDRGLCPFSDKILNAQAAGAVAVIIVNNRANGTPPVGGDPTGITIPSLGLSQADGATLKARLAAGTVHLSISCTGVVNRDGTIDNTVVAHEWGHYISNRLIGDGNGISNNQAVGMGEGWGDFHSLLLSAKDGDGAAAAGGEPWGGVFPVATYVAAASAGDRGYYFGLRRVPYSTDFTKNALTFKHIQDGVALPSDVPTAFGQTGRHNSEVHNTGEVWATMLWECYAALLRDTARYTFVQAQDQMRSYLVAAYKATPVMPTFVDARDALLAVAAAKDDADFKLFAQAFARRGLGLRAVAPDRDSPDNKGLVESFLTGNDAELVLAGLDDSLISCDHDGNLDNNEKGRLLLKIKNVGTGTLSATQARVTTTSPYVVFTAGNVVGFSEIPPFGIASGRLDVALAGVSGVGAIDLTITLSDPSITPPGPAPQTRSFRVNFDTVPNGSATDDVEASQTSWTVGADPSGNTASNFRIFESSATAHWWFGPDPASPADTWLVSPQLKVASTGSFGMSFKHRYAFEADATTNYDAGVVELSANNGSTWTDIGGLLTGGYPGQVASPSSNPLAGRMAFVGKSAAYPEFETVAADLGTSWQGKTVLVRFRIGADDAAADKGWEIDDISFTGLSVKPFTSVVADLNACPPNHPPEAVAGPDITVDERTLVTLVGSGSDPDGDPVTLVWTQKAGPSVVITDATFMAPDVPATTVLTFELRALDGRAFSAPQTQRVTVRNVNRAPIVVAPARVFANAGDVVTIQATGVDPDGDPITWSWRQVSGGHVELSGADGDTVHFQAPTLPADISMGFEVTVADHSLKSAPQLVEVTINGAGYEPYTPPNNKRGCGCASGSGTLGSMLLGLLAIGACRRRRGLFGSA